VTDPTAEPRRWAVVPAAGIGSRMGTAFPKQYLELAGRTVIEHAIERVLLHPMLDGVVVALREDDRWWHATEFAGHPDVVTVPGGAERCHSVLNALDHLAARAAPQDWVLVHDAARPCVRRRDITLLVERLADDPVGGLLGMPVHDTVKRADPAGRIETTLPREHLWRAFTPQMFRLAPLREALRRAVDADVVITDEASAMEHAGHAPCMVEGHADNLKITRPGDLPLAEFFLARQAAETPSGLG
jgi:2-C-methyl-D-erythritol 4-phosphate cytidylyltransferase